jgi:hypothetical protein
VTEKPSLAETHPEIAAQADGWDPRTVTYGSNKKLPWKCLLGHKWLTPVTSRASGTGCPFCCNNRVLPGFNDLATTNPALAAEADGWDPTVILSGTDKKVDWNCSEGHRWTASVYSRSKLGIGCPTCSGRYLNSGVNDLASVNPILAAEATGWDPTKTKSTSNQKLEWICNTGHHWLATVSNRMQGKGCPFCAGRSVLSGYNDLSSVNPDLAAEAHEWDPRTLTPFSNKKVNWKCSQGHIWSAAVCDRSNGSKCPICIGQKILVGFNDLSTTNPRIAMEAFGWDPKTVTSHSNKVRTWRCINEHIWSCSVSARNLGGCPFCSGRRLAAGFNDLATTHPELAAQADGWDPTTVTAGIQEKRNWKCNLGHTWTAVVGSRKAGVGCPYCANKKVQIGFNDLATTNPGLAVEADGWDPTTITFGSTKKLDWKCLYGHKWHATAADRSSGNGCPSCAKFGFKPKDLAWLYLLESEDLDLMQLGITNNPEERLAKHKRSGFGIVRDLRGPIDGYLARDLERSCIQALKNRGAVFASQLGIKQFDGWTESWTTESIAPLNFSELLEWVYSDESEVTTGSQNTQNE